MSNVDEHEPLRQYATARKEFERVHAETVTRLNVVYKTTNLLRSYPHSFLSGHLNLHLPAGHSRPSPEEMRFNIETWPDLPALRSMLEGVHTAFLNMHQAWDLLPQSDQQVMKGSAPAAKLSLT